MKPSIEDVLSTIKHLWMNKKHKKAGITIQELTETMDEHVGNVMPSLLLLAREKQISMKSFSAGMVLILRDSGKAA